MQTIIVKNITALPGETVHPQTMIRALNGIPIPFDLQRAYTQIMNQPKLRLPSTAYLPVLIMDIVEALGAHNRIEAMIYWRDVIRPYYLAIPITSCTLNET